MDRGIWQCKELVIRYCTRGGSSAGVREYTENQLLAFARANPQIKITVTRRVGHPHVKGVYANGQYQRLLLANLHNNEITKALLSLRNRTGRFGSKEKFWARPKSVHRSTQGVWMPEDGAGVAPLRSIFDEPRKKRLPRVQRRPRM